jgi:hypothetical protein
MARIFLVWLVLASCIGWSVYQMKYEVQRLEDRLGKVNRQILADQESIQILRAEWSYLNQPDHLAAMATKFLQLEPVTPRQMVTIDSLPMRRGDGAPQLVAKATPPAPLPNAPTPGAKPPADFDEEATSVPDELPDVPPRAADLSVLLVKGTPQ